MPRIFTFSFMGDASPAPPPAHVQPTKRGSFTTKLAKTGGPLEDVSNTTVSTTDASNEGKTNLLKLLR